MFNHDFVHAYMDIHQKFMWRKSINQLSPTWINEVTHLTVYVYVELESELGIGIYVANQ